jgi:C-terminal processing protease CtpA/Prc
MAGLLIAGSLAGYFLMSGTGEEPVTVHGQSRPQQHSASPPPAQRNDATALTALQRQLEREKQAREDLQSRLESLQMRVEQLEQAGDGRNVIATAPAGQNRQSGTLPAVRSSVQALIDAGISADQAAWIQERLDDIELQQLYLRDRASREGWLKEPRYHKERRELQNAVAELRDEVGDDAYDRMLYTLGRDNRVVVRDVIQHSPAAQYGLQGGDQIIEYDGQRIFTSQELSSLVAQGSPGVMTLVRVRRENDIHDVYLPRGPLGIRMTAARVMP